MMNIIVIGLVAPVGTEKEVFKNYLEKKFNAYDYEVERIKITNDLLFKKNKIKSKKLKKISRSFEIYVKMQICSSLRKKYCKSIMACLVVERINEILKANKNKKIIFIIDELKHLNERDILRHIFGNSFIQISLFSNPTSRLYRINQEPCSAKRLTKRQLKRQFKILTKYMNSEFKTKIHTKRIINSYNELKCPPEHILNKDLSETNKEFKESEAGQQIALLFHLSHFYFNMDSECKYKEMADKFIELLFGEHIGIPNQDEYGMQLAYQASFRTTFPGTRQIGACIISKHGEVITSAAIKAPSKKSDPDVADKENVKKGYDEYRKKIKKWIKEEKIQNDELIDFLKNSLEYHPCTHAEMSAILNAAKLGVSVRNATIYTTTYPCHICTKDIINSGIKKIVFIEQYPKSKNKELYPRDLIDIVTFEGVGPRRYHYVYDERYHKKMQEEKPKNNKLPPFTKFEKYEYLENRIKDILDHYECLTNGKSSESCDHALDTDLLNDLMGVDNKSEQ